MNYLILLTATIVNYNVSIKANSDNLSMPFITTWDTTKAGSCDSCIVIPTFPLIIYNYTVEWGDGTMDTNVNGSIDHEYSTPGIYVIQISGVFPRIHFNNTGDKAKIISIDQWGNTAWTSMKNAFYGCNNLAGQAIDKPDLSNVTDMSRMFAGATSFNQYIDDWDVSNVINMALLFSNASSYNKPLNSWDVCNVNLMSNMFYEASSFNQDLYNWEVTSVRNMLSMFRNASSFDKDIGDWDVSNCVFMDGMFSGATVFNQDIGNWDVSSVRRMYNMFDNASSFNQNLSYNQTTGAWDVSNVEDMSFMFRNATSFNGQLEEWNVTNVTDMTAMFYGASAFTNGTIDSWDVVNLEDMDDMFYNATSFNTDIGNWNVTSVTDMSYMFYNASSFDQDISDWQIGGVAEFNGMLDNSGLSVANYDALLNNWVSQSVQSGMILGVEGLGYCLGEVSRQFMIDNYGWTFEGDGYGDSSTEWITMGGDWYGSTDNWISNRFPNYCDHISIYNASSVSVSPGDKAIGKTLFVELGSELSIPVGAELEITGN